MREFVLCRTISICILLTAVGCSRARSAVAARPDAGALRSSNDGAAAKDAESVEPLQNRALADSGAQLDAASTNRHQGAEQEVNTTTVKASDAGVQANGPGDDDDAGANSPSSLLCTTCGACEEIQEVVSAMHTSTPVTYADPPPSSGPHNPCWASWGIHEEAMVPAERWVHNLEHGGIVYLYNCPMGCDEERAALAKLVAKRGHAVLTAYPALPMRFGVVSWGHRLVSECMDEMAFDAFHVRNAEHGPESNMSAPNPMCPP